MAEHNYNNGVEINLTVNIEKGLAHWTDIKERVLKEDKTVLKDFGHGSKDFTLERVLEIANGHLETLNKEKDERETKEPDKSN